MVNRKSFYGMLLRTAVLKTYIYVAFPALPSFSNHTLSKRRPQQRRTPSRIQFHSNQIPSLFLLLSSSACVCGKDQRPTIINPADGFFFCSQASVAYLSSEERDSAVISLVFPGPISSLEC